jgi:hypothetical protein
MQLVYFASLMSGSTCMTSAKKSPGPEHELQAQKMQQQPVYSLQLEVGNSSNSKLTVCKLQFLCARVLLLDSLIG